MQHTGEGQAVFLTTQFSFPEKEAAASRPSPRIQDVPAEASSRMEDTTCSLRPELPGAQPPPEGLFSQNGQNGRRWERGSPTL